jgi:PAS domain-containing protein
MGMCLNSGGGYPGCHHMLPQDKWSFFSPLDAADEIAAGPSSPERLPCEQLFTASSEAVLILDLSSDMILQANPPAAALLRTTGSALIGTRFLSAFESSSAAQLRHHTGRALDSGASHVMAVRARGGGIDLSAQLSLIRAKSRSYLLVRLEPAVVQAQTVSEAPGSAVLEAIDGAPVGFLITEAGFRVDYANRAFIEMAGAGSETEMRGSPLTRWLRLGETDLRRLAEQLSQREATSHLTTQLCRAGNRSRRVEVCAVPVPEGEHTWWGFTVSELPRLN